MKRKRLFTVQLMRWFPETIIVSVEAISHAQAERIAHKRAKEPDCECQRVVVDQKLPPKVSVLTVMTVDTAMKG